MKITVKIKKIHGTLLKNRQIYGEFAAAIHSHIVLKKQPTALKPVFTP